MTDTKIETVECVYLGQRLFAKNILNEAWMPLSTVNGITADDWGTLEENLSCFSIDRKIRTPAISGGIYTMDVNVEEGRIKQARTGTRKYLRLHPDSSLVARIDATDLANKAKYKSNRQLERLKTQHALESDLKNLRNHYHRLPHQDRVAFELTILNFIRKRD